MSNDLRTVLATAIHNSKVYSLRSQQIDHILTAIAPFVRYTTPVAAVKTNGGVECDTEHGPCACGAWHEDEKSLAWADQKDWEDLKEKLAESERMTEHYKKDALRLAELLVIANQKLNQQ